MEPWRAYRMGHDIASSGFFFDGMEVVAAVSTRTGGFDALRGGIELLLEQRAPTGERMDRAAALCSSAFRTSVSAPAGVDEYRRLMTEGVFEIVNRWSFISDFHTVTRLQAWFYAGFGLGRGETVARGASLFVRLREIAGTSAPLDQMPGNLARMAAEGAKQMAVASEEDDLRSVRPLFEDAAARMQRWALHLRMEPAEVRADGAAEDVAYLADVDRRVDLSFAREPR